jgi:site-specific DNA-methyltransferase (adenine-specific)
VNPYYADELVMLYLGDCREVTEWLAADVLVTDPPYGIGWSRGDNFHRSSKPHTGIAGDEDVSVRDAALDLWGDRPSAVFGSFYAPFPTRLRQVLVWRKPADAGVVGALHRWRRDVEPVFIAGPWPRRNDKRSSVLISSARLQGSPSGMSSRYGHPHANPVDVIEELISEAPPGIIADPFTGAGSTLVAARNLGRKAIGVEIDEAYAEMAARRLSQGVLTAF